MTKLFTLFGRFTPPSVEVYLSFPMALRGVEINNRRGVNGNAPR
jgi:hypothetical protein